MFFRSFYQCLHQALGNRKTTLAFKETEINKPEGETVVLNIERTGYVDSCSRACKLM